MRSLFPEWESFTKKIAHVSRKEILFPEWGNRFSKGGTWFPKRGNRFPEKKGLLQKIAPTNKKVSPFGTPGSVPRKTVSPIRETGCLRKRLLERAIRTKI